MKKYWKVYVIIMAAVLAVVVITDAAFAIAHEIKWNDYNNESTAAQEAGFDVAFSPVYIDEDVMIDGQRYRHYHAYRHVILDGDYHEDIIIKDGDNYYDKTGGDSKDLVIFAKKLNHIGEGEGRYYTLVDAYSICRYKLDDDGYFWIQLSITILGVIAEIVTGIVFAIHAIVLHVRKKKKEQ